MITSCLSPDIGVVKEPSELSQLFGVEDIPDKRQLSAIKKNTIVTIVIILIYVALYIHQSNTDVVLLQCMHSGFSP